MSAEFYLDRRSIRIVLPRDKEKGAVEMVIREKLIRSTLTGALRNSSLGSVSEVPKIVEKLDATPPGAK